MTDLEKEAFLDALRVHTDTLFVAFGIVFVVSFLVVVCGLLVLSARHARRTRK